MTPIFKLYSYYIIVNKKFNIAKLNLDFTIYNGVPIFILLCAII